MDNKWVALIGIAAMVMFMLMAISPLILKGY